VKLIKENKVECNYCRQFPFVKAGLVVPPLKAVLAFSLHLKGRGTCSVLPD